MEDARAATAEDLRSATLVGIVRAPSEARARAIAEGLLDGGFRALEVAADTPGCFGLVAELSRRSRHVRVGVSAVRDLGALAGARASGATFVSFPHVAPELVAEARASGLVSIPGAFTPTEILAAVEAGADFVGLFPVSAGGGPHFLHTLRGALWDIPFLVAGDVSSEEIGAYLSAGAQLVGLTSAISADLEGMDEAKVRARVAERAQACLSRANEARDEVVVLTVATSASETQLDLRALRRLPGSEHVSIESLVPGRRGHGVRLRKVLEHVGFDRSELLTLMSTDGFRRQVSAEQLFDAGILQYARDGHPLDPSDGGPIRLYIVDGTDRCDNVKGLTRIERAGAPSQLPTSTT